MYIEKYTKVEKLPLYSWSIWYYVHQRFRDFHCFQRPSVDPTALALLHKSGLPTTREASPCQWARVSEILCEEKPICMNRQMYNIMFIHILLHILPRNISNVGCLKHSKSESHNSPFKTFFYISLCFISRTYYYFSLCFIREVYNMFMDISTKYDWFS